MVGLRWSGLWRVESLRLSWDGQSMRVCLARRASVFVCPGNEHMSGQEDCIPIAPAYAQMLEQVPEEERNGFVFHPSYGK